MLWEKEKLLITSNFSFSRTVFKSCLFLMCQNEYLWSKGLKEKMLVTSISSISHNVFTLSKTWIIISSTFELKSANTFNFDQSKMLFGKPNPFYLINTSVIVNPIPVAPPVTKATLSLKYNKNYVNYKCLQTDSIHNHYMSWTVTKWGWTLYYMILTFNNPEKEAF